MYLQDGRKCTLGEFLWLETELKRPYRIGGSRLRISGVGNGEYRAEMFFVDDYGYVVGSPQCRPIEYFSFEDLRDGHFTNENNMKSNEAIYKLIKYFDADTKNELIVGFDRVSRSNADIMVQLLQRSDKKERFGYKPIKKYCFCDTNFVGLEGKYDYIENSILGAVCDCFAIQQKQMINNEQVGEK